MLTVSDCGFVLKHCMFNGVMTACDENIKLHLSEMFSCPLLLTDSCCTEEDIQDISYVPSASNKNEPWDKCGLLSSEYVIPCVQCRS